MNQLKHWKPTKTLGINIFSSKFKNGDKIKCLAVLGPHPCRTNVIGKSIRDFKSDLLQDLFPGIWLSEQFLYWKEYYFNVLEFLERNLRFCGKTQWQMFLLVSGRHVGALPDGLQHGVSKFGEKASPHILHKKNCCDLNLGESLCILTFFLLSSYMTVCLHYIRFTHGWYPA